MQFIQPNRYSEIQCVGYMYKDLKKKEKEKPVLS